MAHLTNFSFEFFYAIVIQDASLYQGAKKSKMTTNSNQRGGGGLKCFLSKLACLQKHGTREKIGKFEPNHPNFINETYAKY